MMMRNIVRVLEFSYPFIFIAFLLIFFFFTNNDDLTFATALVGMFIPALQGVFRTFSKNHEEFRRNTKLAKELYSNLRDLLGYLESKEYWDNRERKDEKVNTILKTFNDNQANLRKYFGYNIINEDRKRFDKTITLLEGKYSIIFRNHTPYSCSINEKGMPAGPERLYKSNNSAIEIKERMFKEIVVHLEERYDLKL